MSAKTSTPKLPDLLDLIMAWEGGEASNEQTLELFSQLIKSGQAWTLQGCYGRQAAAFIEAGYISKTGELLRGKDGKG
jgi:hypothetical protein